jgi:hypothetical protein
VCGEGTQARTADVLHPGHVDDQLVLARRHRRLQGLVQVGCGLGVDPRLRQEHDDIAFDSLRNLHLSCLLTLGGQPPVPGA